MLWATKAISEVTKAHAALPEVGVVQVVAQASLQQRGAEVVHLGETFDPLKAPQSRDYSNSGPIIR